MMYRYTHEGGHPHPPTLGSLCALECWKIMVLWSSPTVACWACDQWWRQCIEAAAIEASLPQEASCAGEAQFCSLVLHMMLCLGLCGAIIIMIIIIVIPLSDNCGSIMINRQQSSSVTINHQQSFFKSHLLSSIVINYHPACSKWNVNRGHNSDLLEARRGVDLFDGKANPEWEPFSTIKLLIILSLSKYYGGLSDKQIILLNYLQSENPLIILLFIIVTSKANPWLSQSY